MEHEGDGDTNCDWCTRNNPQMTGKETGKLESKWTSWDHPNYSIIEIGQNTEKSSRDLGRLAISQTPVEKRQQTLVWKTLIEVMIIIITVGRNSCENIRTIRTTITKKQEWEEKQRYGCFKRQTNVISLEKTLRNKLNLF